MSRIQDALAHCCSNCYTGLKDVASATVNWAGKAVSTTSAFIADSAKKVAEFTRPYFKSLAQFARENKQTLIPAAVGVAAGTVLYGIFKNVCCPSKPVVVNTNTTTNV